MKFTSIVTAALLLAASAVHAADISAKPVDLTVGTGSTSLEFGTDFARVAAGDTFANRFNFSLPNIADFDFSLTSITVKVTQGLNLTGFGIYSALNDKRIASGIQKSTGVEDFWTLAYDDLAAGDYYFLVSGDMNAKSGSFAAEGVITVSSVPEPAAPAMLLGGLALLAFAARRQR